MNMARKKTGALIVIQQDVDLSVYEHTGEMFNADVNARLIENIFFKNSPLHDGAMIIADGRIKAGCAERQSAERPGFAPPFGTGNVAGYGCFDYYRIGRTRQDICGS